jgi:hypothetical protein
MGLIGGRSFYELIGEPCPVPVGARVELVHMPADPWPIEPGTRGTVTGGNGAQVDVAWDNGRTLSLAVGMDRWRRL